MDKHAFVICAYGESQYLEPCILSLINQSMKTPVYMATSTPNMYIRNLADKYGLQCFVREGKSDICDDWNFGCNMVDAEWITVAHQDDEYDMDYARYISEAIEANGQEESFVAFSDYRALINGEKLDNINCKIRRFLRNPMKLRFLANKRFWKRRILSLGNSICCPAVTYHKAKIVGNIFTTDLKFNIDWDTFLKFADMPGRFIYINRPLVFYRVHEEATTMKCIDNSLRIKEDTYMFRQFWPQWLVKLIMVFYKKAYGEYVDNKKTV